MRRLATTTSRRGGRTYGISGRAVSPRSGGPLVGSGVLEVQIDQVAADALAALTAMGAQPQHVMRSVIYVRSDDTDVLGTAWRRLTDSAIGAAFTTASTLLGVAQLGFTGQLVEVDLAAALPD